jgi:hypothetical protein
MDSLQLALLDSATSQTKLVSIKQTLLTAIHHLGKPWQLVESSHHANVLCIWVASEADLTLLQSVEKLCPVNRLIVLSTIQTDSKAKWQLFVSEENNHINVLHSFI